MTSSLFLLLIYSILLSSNQQPAARRPRLLGWWDDVENLQLRSSAREPGQDVLRVLHSMSSDLLRLQRDDWGEGEELLKEAELHKRSHEPPLSIDLTFHLLRNMIQMAQLESLRERAQLNRKVLNEVGRK